MQPSNTCPTLDELHTADAETLQQIEAEQIAAAKLDRSDKAAHAKAHVKEAELVTLQAQLARSRDVARERLFSAEKARRCDKRFHPLLVVTANNLPCTYRVQDARISLTDSNKAEVVGLRKSLKEEDRRFQQLHQEAAAHREERKVRVYLVRRSSIAHIVNTWAAGCSRQGTAPPAREHHRSARTGPSGARQRGAGGCHCPRKRTWRKSAQGGD
jgi:hypothetical protein